MPLGIPVDFKDKFLELKRNVENYQEKFYKYLNDQGTKLTPGANLLKGLIDGLETKIAEYVFQWNLLTCQTFKTLYHIAWINRYAIFGMVFITTLMGTF